jgi:hypothetical protein
MGNFIRSISSLISGRPGALQPAGESVSPATEIPADGGVATSMAAHADSMAPAQSNGEHDHGSQPSLPLVAYTVDTTDLAPSRLRRSRNVSLLRQSGAVALTSRTVPTLPAMAMRHPPTHPTRPLLTETERVRLQVMQAQIQLSSLRLYEGPIDGIMSPATATAVRYFQTLKGLRASGTLAAGTLSALGVALIN